LHMKIVSAVLSCGRLAEGLLGARCVTTRSDDSTGSQRVAPTGRGLTMRNVASLRRRQGRTTMPMLTETEKAVLRLRFENPRRVATLQEVAGLMDMPVRTVRRIERHALRKLRLSALGPVAYGFDGWDEA